jgi:hypothetical protein
MRKGGRMDCFHRTRCTTALGDTATVRQQAYRELFRHHLDNALLHEIQDALNHEFVLGRSCFKDKIETMTQRQTRMACSGSTACGRRRRGVFHRLVY